MKNIFGFTPSNIKLYEEALCHKSHSKDAGFNNERLEFLGDCVIDLVVAKRIFEEYPESDEGELTKLKSKLVSREHLLALAKKMKLEKKLQIKKQKSLEIDHILGNVLEAVFGAIFLDQGYEKTVQVINEQFDKHVDIFTVKNTIVDFKSKIYEWSQINRSHLRFDTYDITSGETITYVSELYIDDQLMGKGEAKNKKTAQRKAAEIAWGKLGNKN